MPFALTLAQVGDLKPCAKRYVYALKHLPAGTAITAAQARAAGCAFDDLVWLASAQARKDPAVERRLRLWLADCAAHVLHIFYKVAPSDIRPAQAIEAARAFANGEISAAARDAARDAAQAAAQAAAGAADGAAAGAADGAAARAADGDAARAAARDAAWAAEGAAARDAAWAAEGAAARAAARASEQGWQFDRLVLWLSEDEPEVFPLPESGA